MTWQENVYQQICHRHMPGEDGRNLWAHYHTSWDMVETAHFFRVEVDPSLRWKVWLPM